MQPLWYLTKDGDVDCWNLYRRHYSAAKNKRPKQRQFVGPGEHVVLRTEAGDAFFVWRNFIDDSGQHGVNCAAFRNEGAHQSSELIRQADAIADRLWPDRRHYTYVDAARVRSCNPGFCFLAAGWRHCGATRGGLIVLEKQPHSILDDFEGWWANALNRHGYARLI
jgi:hypothetical protein